MHRRNGAEDEKAMSTIRLVLGANFLYPTPQSHGLAVAWMAKFQSLSLILHESSFHKIIGICSLIEGMNGSLTYLQSQTDHGWVCVRKQVYVIAALQNCWCLNHIGTAYVARH